MEEEDVTVTVLIKFVVIVFRKSGNESSNVKDPVRKAWVLAAMLTA